MTLANYPTWTEQAVCASTDPEEFFGAKGRADRTRRAKAVCAVCSVRAECLEYALGHDEEWGVYGGFTPNERRAIAKDADKRASILAELRSVA